MTFTAIVLVCLLATTPEENCNESTAYDALSQHVDSELGCYLGWQEIIARSALKEQRETMYVKTLCRRGFGK